MSPSNYDTNERPPIPKARVWALLAGLAASVLSLAPSGFYAFRGTPPIRDLFSPFWIVVFWAIQLLLAAYAAITRHGGLTVAIIVVTWFAAALNLLGWFTMLGKVH